MSYEEMSEMENGWTKELERLRKENEELRAIKEQVSDALAMLHAPGFDNNGGPSNIADEVRLLLDNIQTLHEEISEYEQRESA